jgi:titin
VVNNGIGVDISGTVPVGNGANGVELDNAGPRNTIGSGNVISGNTQSGVMIIGTDGNGGQNLAVGNYIGTDKSGMKPVANGGNGVFVYGSASNTIGGMTVTPGTGAGNVISGNALAGVLIFGPVVNSANNNLVAGNLIGTSRDGSSKIPNASDGVEVYNASDNWIGGPTSAFRNIISGNAGNGVFINEFPTLTASSNQVVGNFIGTNALGSAPIGNLGSGVQIIDGISNSIGGANVGTSLGAEVRTLDSGAGNVISGNAQWGIQIILTDSSFSAAMIVALAT